MSEISLEQRTENPRVENSVITPVSMLPEGSDLIEAFFMPDGFVFRVIFLSSFFEWYSLK